MPNNNSLKIFPYAGLDVIIARPLLFSLDKIQRARLPRVCLSSWRLSVDMIYTFLQGRYLLYTTDIEKKKHETIKLDLFVSTILQSGARSGFRVGCIFFSHA